MGTYFRGFHIFFNSSMTKKSELNGFLDSENFGGPYRRFRRTGSWFNFLYFLTYIENFRFQSVKSGNFEIVGFR